MIRILLCLSVSILPHSLILFISTNTLNIFKWNEEQNLITASYFLYKVNMDFLSWLIFKV